MAYRSVADKVKKESYVPQPKGKDIEQRVESVKIEVQKHPRYQWMF